MAWSAIFVPFNETPQGQVSLRSRRLEVTGTKKNGRVRKTSEGRRSQSINQSINQLYLNTVNGSASWFSDMPCDNYNL